MYPAPNKAKFTMSDILSNISRHAKKQVSMTHNEEK